ncbi:MAG: hypothetical protein R3C44_05340 [Chloroflexota bacterium]
MILVLNNDTETDPGWLKPLSQRFDHPRRWRCRQQTTALDTARRFHRAGD